MRARILIIVGCTLATMLVGQGAAQDGPLVRAPVGVSWVTVTIQGTSKRGPFLASTETVRVNRVQMSEPRSGDVLRQALRQGGLEALDVTIPVMTLASSDKGVDEHIRDALQADTHPDIQFQLRSTTGGSNDAMGFVHLNANGILTVAGVEREVVLNITVIPTDTALVVNGSTDLLTTDFGVKPPKGLLGMLKTDPLIHVRFYLVITAQDR